MNLKKAVFDKIVELSPTIADRVAERLATETIEKRVNLIISALTDLDNLTKEMYKCKPDIKTFNDAGEESSVFSKDIWEKRKKLEEKIAKLTKLIENALEDHTKFNDLSTFLGQK